MNRSTRCISNLVLLGSAFGSSPAIATDGFGTLSQEIALAKKEGLPTTRAGLKRKPVPPNQNAAPIYKELQKLKGEQSSADSLAFDKAMTLGRTRPSKQQIAAARNELSARAREMNLIHQAVARPTCDFARDWSLGPSLPFPEFSAMRSVARWLAAESGLLLWDGKPMDAVKNLSLVFRVAGHAESDDIVISQLVAIAIDAIALRGMQNILYHAGSDAKVSDAIARAIDREWKPRSLAKCMRGEMVLALATVDNTRKEGMAALRAMTSGEEDLPKAQSNEMTPAQRRQFDAMVDYSGAFIVHSIRKLHKAADRPYPQARRPFEEVSKAIDNSKDTRLALAAVLVSSPTVPQPRTRGMSVALVTRAAAAVLTYRSRLGKFPAKLGDAMKTIPTDPFDLKPLRYKSIGNGFMVWSVGPSGSFNGNASNESEYNRNAVFRWPMPDMLKQPVR